MKNHFVNFAVINNSVKLFLVCVCLCIGNFVLGQENKVLAFSFQNTTINSTGWPGANDASVTLYDIVHASGTYQFACINVKLNSNNSGYLFITSTGCLGLPAIPNYKLVGIVAHSSSGGSTSTKVGVSSSSGSSASYISGGAIKTWSTIDADYIYTLSGTEVNTMYYLYVTNKNAQITSLTLTYEPVSTPPSFTITPLSNYNALGSVLIDGNTITANPASCVGYETPAYTVSPAGAANVSQDGNIFTVTNLTANCDITINFQQNPQHTVTYSIAGNTDNSETTCSTPAHVPEVNDNEECGTFMGWTTSELATQENAPEALYTNEQLAAMTITGDITFYAVYAEASASSGSGEGNDVFEKVTSEPADWTGEYILVYENSGSANVWDGRDVANCYVTTEITANTITDDNFVKLQIEAMSGGYSIKVVGGTFNGKYIGGVSGSNTISSGASAILNTISISGGSAKITSNTSVMRFNHTSGQNRFRYFKSDTYTNQKPVQLYKKQVSITYSNYTTNCVTCEGLPNFENDIITISDNNHSPISFLSGTILSSGTNCEILSYGFQIADNEEFTNPTFVDSELPYAIGEYFQRENYDISDLDPCQTYYVRAFATNRNGTKYSDVETFYIDKQAKINSLTQSCATLSTASIEIGYDACNASDETKFAIAIRKSSNYPHSLGTNDYESLNANLNFGNGTEFGTTEPYSYLIYKGINDENRPSSLTITGLEPNSIYKLKAYYWNGSRWQESTTCTINMQSFGNVTSSDTAATGCTNIGWVMSKTVCSGNFVVVCTEGDEITTTCENLSGEITADTTFASGTETATGEYVVHSGTARSTNICGLTNETSYTVAVFYIDENGNCIKSNDITFIQTEATILEPGDLAIIAMNNHIQSGDNTADEISMLLFKTISPYTRIDLTDCGYERELAERWGTTEGFLSITRLNSPVPEGSVITMYGRKSINIATYTLDSLTLGEDFDIFVNGEEDNENWKVTCRGPFNLNPKDQIWVMQGGTWQKDNDSPAAISADDAYYTGNVLYGFTATGWKDSIRYRDSQGSRLFPGKECFATTLELSFGTEGNAKYNGPLSPASKIDWMLRLNDEENWGKYSNVLRNYRDDDTPDGSTSYPLIITENDYSYGKWSGKRTDKWCDCSNWYSLVVPVAETNVDIPGGVLNSLKIDGEEAICNSITLLEGANVSCYNNSQFIVNGSITIQNNAEFNIHNDSISTIICYGDITTEGTGKFVPGARTSLTLQKQDVILAPNNNKLTVNNLTLNGNSATFSFDTLCLHGNITKANANLAINNANALSLELAGSAEQQIFGLDLANLIIDKTAGNVTSSSEISISDSLKLVNGKLSANVSLSAEAKAISNENSYVIGKISKIGNGSQFMFPIGTADLYSPMSATISETSNLSLSYLHAAGGENPVDCPVQNGVGNMSEGLNGVSERECYTIEGNGRISDLTLYWYGELAKHLAHNAIVENVKNDSLRTYLVISFATTEGENANQWAIFNPETAPIFYFNEQEQYTSFSVTGEIQLGNQTRGLGKMYIKPGTRKNESVPLMVIDNPTPIELIHFSGECNGNTAELSWSTATETNNEWFAIEKSADAINFTEIARIAGAGNSIEELHYSYADNNLLAGNNYYRLRQIDYDGVSSISDIISLSCGDDVFGSAEPAIKAYPNPFEDDITIVIENMNEEYSLELYNELGQLVDNRSANRQNTSHQLHLSNLATGTYTVRVVSTNYVLMQKIVKQ